MLDGAPMATANRVIRLTMQRLLSVSRRWALMNMPALSCGRRAVTDRFGAAMRCGGRAACLRKTVRAVELAARLGPGREFRFSLVLRPELGIDPSAGRTQVPRNVLRTRSEPCSGRSTAVPSKNLNRPGLG
jgi:hypothetical protein